LGFFLEEKVISSFSWEEMGFLLGRKPFLP